MNEANWVSIIALFGSLVLATSALRGHRIGFSKAMIMACAWLAIFLLVAAVFAAARGASLP